jgi:hypothetical protein
MIGLAAADAMIRAQRDGAAPAPPAQISLD